jgi:phosphoribosyl 1,2-cyclic phosphodiesterase
MHGLLGLRVLASGSGGNCAALVVREGAGARVILIDAGLSPRRTRTLLGVCGLGGLPIAAILLTHLDHDHWQETWARARPEGCETIVHGAHRGRAAREGAFFGRARIIEREAEVCGLRVRAMLAAHDEEGVAAYRIESPCGASLGWATDLGRVTEDLAAHLAGVDVLGIESNYCPRMQAESDRPAFLKRRIMGGAGHLSNAESAAAAGRIGATRARVLLHLSRQCNTPDLALAAHAGGETPVVVASQDAPTGWISLSREAAMSAGGPTLAPHA